MLKTIRLSLTILLLALASTESTDAQSLFDEIVVNGEIVATDSIVPPTAIVAPINMDRRARLRSSKEVVEPSLWDLTDADGNLLDPEMFGPQILEVDSTREVSDYMFPMTFYMPAIFKGYDIHIDRAETDPFATDAPLLEDMNWAQRQIYSHNRAKVFLQRFATANPELVPYNINTMPLPPKEFVMTVDPSMAKINVVELTPDVKEMASEAPNLEIKRINWLRNFDGSLQFSQAYVSPNWYQGGNSNLNAILNLLYNVKLNPAFYPKVILEATATYKLGMNNAPDDSVHKYNISEDILQINAKFGYKALKRWYYSINAQFKTQLLNNYKKNSNELTAAFLSPGELNIGVGMTYSYTDAKKIVEFNAAINPLSYNLKMCTNNRLNPAAFGIKDGHRTISDYGSSSEVTFRWKMAYNIEYFSRLFLFTNYEYATGDWENTITFNINRFLSTTFYAHLRYQSDASRYEDTAWRLWQFKEILSIGFSYKFNRS